MTFTSRTARTAVSNGLGLLALALPISACRDRPDAAIDIAAATQPNQPGTPQEVPGASATLDRTGNPSPSVTPGDAGANAPPVLTVGELKPEIPPDACPPGMLHVPGGEFWMGSPRRRGAREERPRFQTRVADYCLGEKEVTAAQYAECASSGRCTPPHGSQFTCNYGRRDAHPINCVDWNQAHDYCASQGSRLPTELEWEYAARGGAQYSTYAWGEESPDDRACWKANHSCEVGGYAAGAFGLYDVTGNVWEWTNDWFGEYPWPKPAGQNKVFRGGGWSRRFEKWMRGTLRNRTNPETWGSHLGFRCARLAKNAECPFGEGDEPGLCRHGVIEVECDDPRHHWNGLRCALPGDPECRAGYEPVAGHGCVAKASASAATRSREASESEEQPTSKRSPEFDADCRQNQPKRPNAFLFEGGSHEGRNRLGRENGCKNRDVGVGWNSACCP